MLAIRLQRRGRKGHAQFRVIVQDSRISPKRGKIVANLGPYDPHTKTAVIDKESAEKYLSNGAQPSDRVIRIFKENKITLPKWVNEPKKQEGKLKNPEKLRKNRPAEAEAPAEEPADEEAPAETTDAPVEKEETPAEEPAEAEAKTEEEPAEEPAKEEAKPEAETEEKAEEAKKPEAE